MYIRIQVHHQFSATGGPSPPLIRSKLRECAWNPPGGGDRRVEFAPLRSGLWSSGLIRAGRSFPVADFRGWLCGPASISTPWQPRRTVWLFCLSSKTDLARLWKSVVGLYFLNSTPKELEDWRNSSYHWKYWSYFLEMFCLQYLYPME